MFCKNLIIKLLFLLFLAPQGLLAHIVVDVEEFHFASEGRKGLRVCVFDTDAQRFKHVDYYQYPSSSKDRSKLGTIPFNYFGLEFSYDGRISVPGGFDLANFIIRTRGVIEYDQMDGWDHRCDTGVGQQVLRTKPAIKKASYIVDLLSKFTSSKQGDQFKACYYKGKSAEEEEIKYFSAFVVGERGRVGELATELTMLSFGYDRLGSQNGSNQGFDGVFTDDSDDPELFLTESKCRAESKAAQKVLEEALSEQGIYDKLTRMTKTHKATKKVIKGFIRRSPQKIVKFAHRVKPSGECQCALQVFNNTNYQLLALSQAERDEMLKDFLEKQKTKKKK